MINQYQPLDSGIHYFQTNPNQKAIRFFPRPPPADRTNRPISSLKCYRLTIWFWKKKSSPTSRHLVNLNKHHILWSSNFGEKPRLQASDDWKFSHLPVELDPPTGLCRISRQTLGDEPVKLAGMQQYAGIWNEHVRVVPVSHLFANDVLLATKAT